MKFFFSSFVFLLSGSSLAQNHIIRHLHHLAIGTPRPIEFNGLPHLDVEEMRPPKHLQAFGELAKKYNAVEENLHQEIEKQINQVNLVESEFLASDLHKEALAMKLRRVV